MSMQLVGQRRDAIAELAPCLGEGCRGPWQPLAGWLGVADGGSSRSGSPLLHAPPQKACAGKQSDSGGHGGDGRLPITTAPGRTVGMVQKGVEIGRTRYFADLGQALLNTVPAIRVRMAERNIGVASELTRDLGLIAGKAGRIGHCYPDRQFGENARRDFVGMLQGIPPAFDRSLAKTQNQRWVGL